MIKKFLNDHPWVKVLIAPFCVLLFFWSISMTLLLWEKDYHDHGYRLAPEYAKFSFFLLLFTFASLPVLIWRLIQAIQGNQNTPKLKKIFYGILLFLFQASLICGALASYFALAFNMEFLGPSYLGYKVASPDHSKTAYLYNSGLFGDCMVYIRGKGQFYLTKKEIRKLRCHRDEPLPILKWSQNSQAVDLYNSDGSLYNKMPKPFTIPGFYAH